MIVAFKMQCDDNDNYREDLDEIVLEESIASGSNLIINASEDGECETIEDKSDDDGGEEDQGCKDESSSPIYVPSDPKTWSEKHIEKWVQWSSQMFNIKPPLDVSRFPKTGGEMAKFTKADFYISCASFEGGKSVAQHFKYMMESVGGIYDETLNDNDDPSE